MKKQVKKLVLAKETVRTLENGQLAKAAGATGHSCSGEGPRICQVVDDTFTCYC